MVADLTVIDASYNLAAGAAVVGTICGVLENFKGPTGKVFGAGAIVFTLFGGFVAFQTSNLRFKFDESSFSLVKADGSSVGENVVVGGENSWKYNTFVNYDFLPSEDFPILVYFKETQTPSDAWVEAPIVVDNAEGQAHFFPAIANTAQLKEQFELHNCKKL
jgi:NIMA (never in mitosis gene a)-related kinase